MMTCYILQGVTGLMMSFSICCEVYTFMMQLMQLLLWHVNDSMLNAVSIDGFMMHIAVI